MTVANSKPVDNVPTNVSTIWSSLSRYRAVQFIPHQIYSITRQMAGDRLTILNNPNIAQYWSGHAHFGSS